MCLKSTTYRHRSYLHLMSVRPEIQRRLESLNAHTQILFDILRKDIVAVHVKPEDNSWSALETANHIYLAEKLSLQYVRYKLTKPDPIPPKHPGIWLRTYLLKWTLISPLKFKAPPTINMRNAQPVLAVEELVAQWKMLREELLELLDQHEEQFRGRLLYKHPFAGRMTLNQMLIFFQDHLVHHTRQLKRILRRVKR